MMDRRETIGFIGAGQLGEPTAERILEAGWDLLVYARRDDVRDRLREAGATLVGSPRDAAAADIVVLFLFSDDQLTDVALGADGLIAGMRPGTTLVVHTTASLATLTALVKAGTDAGIDVLDAPVSGTATDIRAGRLTVLVGGQPAAVDRCRALFASYADAVLAVGGSGAAMKAKLINNILFAANVQLVGAAARLAEQLGLEPIATLRSLTECSSASKAMGYLVAAGDVEGFAAGISHFLRKDVAACQQTAGELSVDLGLLADVALHGPLDVA
jgi:3-hydroxyisobutyrate dehydrogenase-like beta-hydroxyacid dehydrogenase